MSTPVGKPAKQPNILDYAPRHVREGGGPRRVDEDATPPRRPADDEPLDNTRPEDEQYDVPLAPEAPRDGTGGADRDGDTYERRVPRFESQQRRPEKTEFDDDFAQLAALLESIRRGGDPVEPPTIESPRRINTSPPLDPEPEPESDIYIEGLRLPRSLHPSFVPPPFELEQRTSLLKIVGGVTAACIVAAALAFVMVGGWHSSTPRATAHKDVAAVADRAVASDAQRAPHRASAPGPVRVAFAETALNGPPAAAPQKIELASVPPTAAPVASSAPRAVPVVRVAPWPADTPSNTMRNAPPAAPPSPATPTVGLAPSPPPPRPALEAQQIKLLLEQGKQFVAVGDLVTARTVLRRAADADVAAGALALAETYDPAVLAKLGVRGLGGDVDQARRWYERARELGSDEAAQHLALLASQ
jgi:hypothetical protein